MSVAKCIIISSWVVVSLSVSSLALIDIWTLVYYTLSLCSPPSLYLKSDHRRALMSLLFSFAKCHTSGFTKGLLGYHFSTLYLYFNSKKQLANENNREFIPMAINCVNVLRSCHNDDNDNQRVFAHWTSLHIPSLYFIHPTSSVLSSGNRILSASTTTSQIAIRYVVAGKFMTSVHVPLQSQPLVAFHFILFQLRYSAHFKLPLLHCNPSSMQFLFQLLSLYSSQATATIGSHSRLFKVGE